MTFTLAGYCRSLNRLRALRQISQLAGRSQASSA
jgi:hypothetical protein